MLHDAVFPHAGLDLFPEGQDLCGEVGLRGSGEDRRSALKLHSHKGITWDEELHYCGVIAGAEGGADEGGVCGERVADAVEVEGLGTTGGCACEGVDLVLNGAVGREGGSALLGDEVENVFEGQDPTRGDVRGGLRSGVVLIAEGEEGGKRVELIFTFKDNVGVVCGVDGISLPVGGSMGVSMVCRLGQ